MTTMFKAALVLVAGIANSASAALPAALATCCEIGAACCNGGGCC